MPFTARGRAACTTSQVVVPVGPSADSVTIRPAATLVPLRAAGGGLEVLLLQRHAGSAFLGGAYVFPGGALDREDASRAWSTRIIGLGSAAANRKLRVTKGALAYWVAAVRECFEESGLLYAVDRDGEPPSLGRLPAIVRARAALNARTTTFAAFLAAEDLYIPAGSLAYFAHWITPPLRSRRFDARFFLAQAPEGQDAMHDSVETVHSLWIAPQEALDRAARGEIEMAFATQSTLRLLARFGTPDEAIAHARSLQAVDCNRPCVAQGCEGEKIFRLGDAPYHEIHWSDPDETTQSTYDLTPDVPKRLDRYVTRIVAANPGVMTGPGTNTYLVGEEALAVIDPGPLLDEHVRAILAAADGRIRWIVCTHTHRDHSPAAAALKAETGAQLIGRPARPGDRQDGTFAPDHAPQDGERLVLADGVALQAIHTPGHASNHLCYLLEPTRMLFTGDHVMQGSTVIIDPPDGDMRAYLASLDRLLELDPAILAPGHGYLIGTPQREVRRLIAHRLARENKVRAALEALGPATLEALVPEVYDDVDPRRHRAAARSLLAHLEKLIAEGTVCRDEERFALVPAGQC
jgi:glyoxylase-like metal-dependent hydrolase (beta-lactamase superfamily II)/8-oxo-dGTP pyrophosphatase MutT (NUDIX family)